MTQPQIDRQTGFSLLEILISVAVTIIVLAIVVPNFTGVVRSNKLTTAVNDFVAALHLTRSEAVRAGGATICASDNQEDCNSSDWHDGWIVFSDYNSDGNRDGDEPIIRASQGVPASVTIDAGGDTITYGSNGFLFPAGTTKSVVFCSEGATDLDGRQVNVSTAGRPNTEVYGSCT
jgi:type IV fimbrial biogenesis protein FimT